MPRQRRRKVRNGTLDDPAGGIVESVQTLTDEENAKTTKRVGREIATRLGRSRAVLVMLTLPSKLMDVIDSMINSG